jgi:hypothetical protein
VVLESIPADAQDRVERRLVGMRAAILAAASAAEAGGEAEEWLQVRPYAICPGYLLTSLCVSGIDALLIVWLARLVLLQHLGTGASEEACAVACVLAYALRRADSWTSWF